MKKTLILILLALQSFAQVVIEDSTGRRYTIPSGLYKQVSTPVVDLPKHRVLTPLNNPLTAKVQVQGEYEIHYIECREDDHLKLRISQDNGQLLLTEYGNSLQSASITLNGWTDLSNSAKLENEPIRPYEQYHISKWSVGAGSLREFWKAMYQTPKAPQKRSEVIFYVVPKGETWNPAGESPNPIGRPAAFAKVPAFKLKNRTYGFEYDFLDESNARLDELDITFNRKKGQRHLKLYSSVLSSFLRKLPVRKGFEDLTEKECIDFANTLPIEAIVAFDIEPGPGDGWIINYDGPNFVRNMSIVINRLKERGAMAYNWLDSPSRSPNNISLDDVQFGTGGSYGKDFVKFGQMYKRLPDVKRRANPYSVISTGYGYNSYDTNFGDDDAGAVNTSPQYTYLRALDVSELWSRVWPEKEQVYFSWAFQEFDFVSFPPNYVVEIPEHNARSKRVDNKPLYPPNQWEDNMTLSLITSKYLFYWCPGPVGWNPANTASYNRQYVGVDDKGKPNFHNWIFEKGSAPAADKFYIGKESTAINATITAAYNFSRVQDAADGSRYAPAFTWQRATKNGGVEAADLVEAIADGSWYHQALAKKQPFAIVLENNGKRVLFFQDVWARPGLFTDFTVTVNGIEYKGKTNGNRLFIAEL